MLDITSGDTMYAIIEASGKQYQVKKDDIIEIDLMKETTDNIPLPKILLLHNGTETIVGTPYVSNWQIEAQYIEQTKGPKVIAYKYKRRKNYRRKVGHRQRYTKIKIIEFKEKGTK